MVTPVRAQLRRVRGYLFVRTWPEAADLRNHRYWTRGELGSYRDATSETGTKRPGRSGDIR